MLNAIFYKTEQGNEPVREWLKELPKEEKRSIGEDVRDIQRSWPAGPPLVKKIDKDLHEARTRLQDKISRVIFHIDGNDMILIHGFIKKTDKLPTKDLKTAKERLKLWREQK